jgi:hypothetical protein
MILPLVQYSLYVCAMVMYFGYVHTQQSPTICTSH